MRVEGGQDELPGRRGEGGGRSQVGGGGQEEEEEVDTQIKSQTETK